MLIVSLPQVHQKELLEKIIRHPEVGAVRYNTGMRAHFSPLEVVQKIQAIALPLGKPVYIDLKGKQLRVVEWANLPEGPILLNHKIKVQLPAKIYFRGESEPCEIKEVVNGHELFVDPLPKMAVGQGQAVNIISPKLEVEGGLLALDYEYVQAALQEGIKNFMLSFVESWEDVRELDDAFGKHILETRVCLKIESQAGVDFVDLSRTLTTLDRYRLMAARDDLAIQIGPFNMPKALALIAKKDRWAICASRLFMGLENGEVSVADISDLRYMKSLGYHDFMLSDGISREYFTAAMEAWQEYKKAN